MPATTITPKVTPRTGARRAQPRSSGIRPVPNVARSEAAHAANALRVTTYARIHIRAGAQAAGIERGDRQQDDARVADDRVPDDVLQVVLDPGRERGQDDRGDTDREDDGPLVVHLDEERGDRVVRPGQRDDGERRGPPGGHDREGRLGHGVGQPGGPDVERDRAEPDRDGQREGQVCQSEDDRLRRQLAQVPADPCGRGDGHRPGDDERAQGPDADGGTDPAAGRREGQEDTAEAAGGGGQHRDARIGQRQGQAAPTERAQHHGRGVSTRAGGEPDDRERQPDERPEDQEEPDVLRRRDAGAADEEGLLRVDGEGCDDGDRQPGDPHARGNALPRSPDERDAGGSERDDQEDDEAHGRSSSGWA